MRFSLDSRAHSEVGLVRKNNQDSAYLSPTLLVVADGMGGAAAGDLASAVAVKEIEKADGAFTGEHMLEVMAGALTRANDLLADLVAADPRLDGMGTTVCGAMFSGDQLGMAHIGDSRGYLMRDGELRRITHDHSWVQSLVDEGRITEQEAAVHPHRNLLLRVLNGQPIHEPDFWLLDVQLGDRLMFCSDGLCGLVDDDQIARIMAEPGLDDVLADLVDAARRAGGHDNITVALADVVEQSAALDSSTPLLLGAAATVTIPHVPASSHTEPGDTDAEASPGPRAPAAADSLDPDSPPPGLIDPDAGEVVRYAPTQGRRHLVGPLISTLVAVLVLALAGVGGLQWTRTRYFVGASDDHVAIFRGIPGSVLGFTLSNRYEVQDTRVTDLPVYYANQVRAGMTPGTLSTARATSQVLKAKAEACITKRKARERPASTTAVQTPATVSTVPGPAVSSATGSPDADPDDC